MKRLSLALLMHRDDFTMNKKIPRRDAITMLTSAGAALAFGCGGNGTPTSPSPAPRSLSRSPS